MRVLTAVFLTLVVFVIVTISQYYALHYTSRLIYPRHGSAYAVTLAVALLSLGHLFQGGLYAGGVWLGDHALGLGTLEPSEPDQTVTFLDHFYFSLVNFSTLGRGALTPTEGLRLITAVEAFHGFLLITSSGTYMFQISSGNAPFARDG